MPAVQIQLTPDAEPEEVAAIVAALSFAVGDDPGVSGSGPTAPAWAAAAALEAQDLDGTPGGTHRTWGSAERSRRVRRWSSGIVGG